ARVAAGRAAHLRALLGLAAVARRSRGAAEARARRGRQRCGARALEAGKRGPALAAARREAGARARAMMRWLRCLLTLIALSLPARAEAAVRSFGLVVGNNFSNDPGVKPLRYADDDAVNNARLLGQLGAEVVLLVQMDADTARLAPGLATAAPTRAALDAALA